MSFRQFLLVLRARWKVAAGIFGAVVLLGMVYTLLQPSQYTASSSVLVTSKVDPVAGVVASTQMMSSYVATQVDIISSKRVAQRAVKVLKLDQNPDFVSQWKEATDGQGDIVIWLANKLEKKLSVTPSRDSSVIDISMEWTDRHTAMVMANAFAQAYIDTTVELKVDPAKQYAAYFEERSRALRADLQAKQKRLSDYQNSTGIVATTDARWDVENSRLSELTSQLLTVQALRQDSQSRQAQASGDFDSLPEVLQSPLISGLKSDLSRAEAKLKDIQTSYGKNHPDYQTTVAEIASLHERIQQESAKVAAALGSTTQINLRRESELRQAVDAQKKRMMELTHENDQVSNLQNDVQTAQRNLDAVTQRLAQSSLESQTSQTDVLLLTPAIEPQLRSSPRLFLSLLVCLFLGGVLGIAAAIFQEITDRRIREPSDLTQLLGLPLLATIPRFKTDRRTDPLPPPALTRVEPAAI
jgi:chain length determinant protein EpsF